MTDNDTYLKWCADMGLMPKASGLHIWQAAIAHAQQERKPEPSVAAVKAAFEEGFYAAKTYNDDLLNDSDEEWLKSAVCASLKETP